jgi:hypothetical protein
MKFKEKFLNIAFCHFKTSLSDLQACHIELRISTELIIGLQFVKCTQVIALVLCKYFMTL